MQDSVSGRVKESYEDFAYRFQLAQGLPEDQRGIIFIGNTRAGKSTLALSMTGVAMKVVYDSGNLTYVNPTDKKFQQIVRNSQTSVTQKPNFYKKSNYNKCAIVDMPGNADNSRFRQLINFHYIRTMASKLKEVRFLIVIKLRLVNERFQLSGEELNMLDSFRKTFPNCSNYVTIIINKIQDIKNNEAKAKKGFRDSISACQNTDLKKFFQGITDSKIYVIESPEYRKSPKGESKYEEPYTNINLKTKEIMTSLQANQQAEFIKLKDIEKKTLDIFKMGDNVRNMEFKEKMDSYMQGIVDRLREAASVFKEIIAKLTRSVVSEKSCEHELIGLIDLFLSQHNIESPDKKKLTIEKPKAHVLLRKSKLLELLHLITLKEYQFQNKENDNKETPQSMGKKTDFWNKVVNDFLRKLCEVVDCLFNNKELNERMVEFFLFFHRRVTESSFLSHVIVEQDMLNDLQKGKYFGQFHQDIISELGYLLDEKFSQQFLDLAQYFAHINVPKVFAEHKNHFTELQKELISDFDILLKIAESPLKDTYETVIKPAIIKRKEETINFFIIHYQPKPQELSSQVEKLLQLYQNAKIEMRLELLHKLAKLLERQKDFKTTAILYLYLHLSEEAMRVLALLEPTLKREEAVEWFSEFAKILTEHGKFSYAQRCLQSAKKHSSGQIIRYIQLQQRCLQLNDPNFTADIIAKRTKLKDKELLWNWEAIGEEISFQIRRLHMKVASNITKPILLSKHR